MDPIVIIGCGASKRTTAAKAVELYTGPLYLARLGYARALGGPHYVLSGMHGLIPADRVIDPYELDLRKLRPVERGRFDTRVRNEVREQISKASPIVALVAGPYAAWIPEARSEGYEVTVPAEGLALGPSIKVLRAGPTVARPLSYEEQATAIEAELATEQPAADDEWTVTTGALRALLARAAVRSAA